MQEIQQNTLPTPRPSGEVMLSVVVPAFNEEEALEIFHQRLRAAVSTLGVRLEVVYVDDGSTDRTPLILAQMQAADPSVGFLRFSRNFGKETALSAGLNHVHGDVVLVIDADLQDPPELIPLMMEAWQRGVDVVNMQRVSRAGETVLKRATAHLFYRLINQLSEVPIPVDVGDFRLLSRRAVDALNRMPERNRFMKGLFAWIGFRQETLTYHREARAAGSSKWPYWRLWKLAVEGVTGFSTAPLKLALYFGLATSAIAFISLVYFLVKTWLIGDPVPGFPATIVTVLFLGGVQIASIGILGEYIARIFIESKGRPLYLIDTYQPAEISAPIRDTRTS
jgi:glycosyltransferase involved in cell wall biosynthesis